MMLHTSFVVLINVDSVLTLQHVLLAVAEWLRLSSSVSQPLMKQLAVCVFLFLWLSGRGMRLVKMTSVRFCKNTAVWFYKQCRFFSFWFFDLCMCTLLSAFQFTVTDAIFHIYGSLV